MRFPDSIQKWLLEHDHPSVRYFTLTDLLDRPLLDPEVRKARLAIMETGDVPILLEGQTDGGYWGNPEDFYVPRYTSAIWRFMQLAEYGADGSDPRIRNTAEYILHRAQLEHGGFVSNSVASQPPDERGLLCLTGNMVWSFIRFGYLEDPRIQKAIDWIVHFSRFDDGNATTWPAWLPDNPDDGCWGRHTCFRGAVAVLQALAEIPEKHRSEAVRHVLDEGKEFFLLHHVFKHSHNLDKPIAKLTKAGFPLWYDNDLLRMLLLLTRLNTKDNRMDEAMGRLAKKQTKDGYWKQQHVYSKTRWTGFMPVPVVENGHPSKWVTLKALTVLKRQGQ